MTKLVFASLLLTCSIASTATVAADSAARAPIPPPATCSIDARVMVQVDHLSKVGKQAPMSTFELRTSGAWSYVERRDNRIHKTLTGCLDKAKVDSVRTAFARAPWQTTPVQLRCMAESMSYTEYRFDGKAVARREMCDGHSYDKQSQLALDTVTALVVVLVSPTR